MVLATAAGAPAAGATAAAAAPAAAQGHRTVVYYQTNYDRSGTYYSPLPLEGIATDIHVAAIHLNDDGAYLNDDLPSAPKLGRMWSDLAKLQASGIKVQGMLGGAGVGSFANLHRDFSYYYGMLKDMLRTYHLDGVDLDIEETFSLADTERLIDQLRADFGPGFVITLVPVATDLSGESTFSGGFSYRQLEQERGSEITHYLGQFYCGWGMLSDTSGYDAIIANGFSPSRVVAAAITNPATCGGYVDPATLAWTLRNLVARYPGFGGGAGWEYFNSVPVSPGTGPASWYANVANAMNG